MSFIRLFFIFLLLILIVAGVGFYGGRELILYWAGQSVARAAQQTTKPTTWKNFVPGCESTSLNSGLSFAGFQLRFLDQKSYALEVNCTNSEPVVRETRELPYGVKKTSGSAGFYYDYNQQTVQGEVTLELWGQQKTVHSTADQTFAQSWGKSNYLASQPASICLAHGLKCCSGINEVGSGDQQLFGVTDCPDTCYAQCLQRPVLLSFQTNPSVDHETRQVTMPGTSTLVLLAYSFGAEESPIKEVVVNFGDGQQQSYFTPTGEISHEYECRQPTMCVFPITIKAIDERGVESAETRLSTAIIQLDPNSQAVLY